MDSEFAEARALVFEPYTMFRVRAMTGRAVNVSEHGFRHGRSEGVWPPDPAAANIFVFGGSTTFGYGLPDDRTIPAQLAEQLRGQVPGARVAVYNFATPNHVAVQERIRFEQLLLDGHVPRVAVFIDGFDEFVGPYYAPLMLSRYIAATSARSIPQRASQVVRELSSRMFRGSTAPDETSGRLPVPDAVLDQYASNMRLIGAACREFAVRPLFVWQPVPCYRYDGKSADHGGDSAHLLDCVRAGYARMEGRRRHLGDEFLWLADIQQGRTADLYLDPDHYTAEFSGEIAQRIARHLIDRSWMG
jgi:hypothetical protein